MANEADSLKEGITTLANTVADGAKNAADAVAAAANEAAEATADAVAEVKVDEKPACDGKSCDKGLVIAGIAVLAVIAIVFLCRKKKHGGGCCCCGGDKTDAAGKTDAPQVEIYVGNLNYDMTEPQLQKEFERFGVVSSARIIGHRASGKSKGYGFVVMPHRKEAAIAIKNLHNREIMGRKLRVNEARRGQMSADTAANGTVGQKAK